MKISSTGSYVFAVLAIASCSQQPCPSKPATSPTLSINCSGEPNESITVSPNEIVSLERQALLGSQNAAGELVHIYGLQKHYSYENVLYWLLIAVENGSSEAMVLVADNLNRKGDYADLVRARFWIARAEQLHAASNVPIKRRIDTNLVDAERHPITVTVSIRNALLGSAEAALQLASKYKSQGNTPESLRWTRIAAQNGGSFAMHSYGALLEKSNDSKDQLRAQYWLSRSAPWVTE